MKNSLKTSDISPAQLNYIIRAKKFRTKKRLGQNFLVDPDVIDTIESCVKSEDTILEIGPGIGFVTEKLVASAKKVVAVELDSDAVQILEKNLSKYENFTLINDDILKVQLEDIFPDEFKTGEKINVIANIPYYITSPILAHLLGEIDDINNKNRGMIDEIILMVQLEVAKRITANSNSANKEYGMLTILSNFWAETEIIKDVSRSSFLPSPKVDSALVRIKTSSIPKCEISKYLKRTIKACFATRRKNIKNSLLNAGFKSVNEVLAKAGISPDTRGEKLSIEEFYSLSKILEEFDCE